MNPKTKRIRRYVRWLRRPQCPWIITFSAQPPYTDLAVRVELR